MRACVRARACACVSLCVCVCVWVGGWVGGCGCGCGCGCFQQQTCTFSSFFLDQYRHRSVTENSMPVLFSFLFNTQKKSEDSGMLSKESAMELLFKTEANSKI